MISRAEIESIWNDTEALEGWDFSRIRSERPAIPWQYDSVVRSLLSSSDDVLDVGTGGGEKIANLATSFRSAVGIDYSPEMIETAVQNTPAALSGKLSFRVSSAEATGQDSSSVNAVINNHSVIDVDEIERVLKPGGYFISQQVGKRNLSNMLAPFGGQDFSAEQQPEVIQSKLEERGFSVQRFEEYDVEYKLLDLESLLFHVKAIVGYLGTYVEGESTIDHLEQMIAATSDGSGCYVSNEHRWLIVARKNAYD